MAAAGSLFRAASATIADDLRRLGWAHHSSLAAEDDILVAISNVGESLGGRVQGRNGKKLEILAPTASYLAHPRSLSALYGLGRLPLHVETSHRPRPCRYVILGCLDPGAPSVATVLVDRHTLDLSGSDIALLKSAAVLVRSGRCSFYSTIMLSDAPFLRFDPGCMEPVNDRGRAAMQMVEERLAHASQFITTGELGIFWLSTTGECCTDAPPPQRRLDGDWRGHWSMAEQVFVAIDGDALHAKSKVYMGRALARKDHGDLDEYQLWASVALELLGKAALARKHPSLIVDPMHWQSLFVAAGINITTDVKTIAAKTLFERLTHVVPRFDKTVQKFCMDIAERRNAELHSADLPFRAMRLDAWEARYWHACDTILRHMPSSLEDWLGAAEAAAPRQLLEEAAAALVAATKLRVQAAKQSFMERKKADRERLRMEAELREPG